MRVAAIQHDIFWQDQTANFSRLQPTIDGAVATGARLVVLPGHFATGSDDPAVAEQEDGRTTEFLANTASETGVWVCGSVSIRYPDGVADTAVLAGPDGTLNRSRALRDPDPAARARAERLPSFVVGDLRVTPVVGQDLGNPHDFWAVAADTDLFVISGEEPESRRQKWCVLLAARAIENQCYVVGANRVGSTGGLSYAGDSRIIDPQGEVLTSGSGVETILLATLEPALVRFTRDRNPLPGVARGAPAITLP